VTSDKTYRMNIQKDYSTDMFLL